MSIFQRLTNNLVLKVFSLALAILLSFFVLRYINPDWTDDVPLGLRVDNLAESLVVVDPIPMRDGPWIKVNGPINTVRLMESVALTAYLDCSTIVEPGVYNVPVKLPDLGDLQVVTGVQARPDQDRGKGVGNPEYRSQPAGNRRRELRGG